MITKPLDCGLGIFGLYRTFGPLLAGKHVDDKTIASVFGGVFWNLNRILSPFASNLHVFGVKMILIELYGVAHYFVYANC